MNKTDLIQKVKALDGLSQDERAYLINLVNTKKKYGLVWEDKPEEVEEQLRENLPVLKETKEKAIVNGEDYPNHILIEGDNLHALTALSFTHEGKIDVIYIDPPYNRGENDFIYNDDYVDKEDTFKHSKWLSFMERRLKIAKRLLSDNGIILISIDDNEVCQLKMLCDEVFIAKNFIEIFSWEKTQSPSNLSNKTKKRLEYVLCYEKIKNTNRYVGLSQDNPNDNPLLKSNNTVKELNFPKDKVTCTLKEDFHFIAGEYGTKVNKVILKKDVWYRNGKFEDDILLEAKFVWTQNNLKDEIEKKTKIIFKGKSLAPRYDKADYKPEVPPNLIDERWGIATNDVAKTELQGFGITNFQYPKPSSLIKYLVSFNGKNDSTVLDFFAGTGTTLQAVVELNEKDDGVRKCILVSNNEVVNGTLNKICEEVTYKRTSSIIKGYTKPSGEDIEGLNCNNLRYYKSEFVSREPSLKNKRALTQFATELLCIKEDCYTEQKIKIKQAKLFSNPRVTLLILFDDHIIPDAVDLIKGMDAKEIKVYVFSMGSDPYTEDFAEVLDKVTLCALPDAIYKAYQNVLPKKNRTVPLMEEVSETPTNESGEQLSIL